MWRLRIGVLLASGVFALGLCSAAWAASGGDANAGDVWVDNVGQQSADPGHYSGISEAGANGDTAAAQGLHFKLDFSQDPQKHKTLWIDCTAGSSSGGGAGTPTSTGGDPSTTGGGTTSGASINTPAVTTMSIGAVKTSIGAIRISRPKAHKARKRRKHRKLVHRKRRHKVHKRHVKAVTVHAPTFTG